MSVIQQIRLRNYDDFHDNEDKRQGKGKYVYASGSVYEGQWHDDMMQGQGKFVFASGSVYEGQWHDGKMQG